MGAVAPKKSSGLRSFYFSKRQAISVVTNNRISTNTIYKIGTLEKKRKNIREI